MTYTAASASDEEQGSYSRVMLQVIPRQWMDRGPDAIADDGAGVAIEDGEQKRMRR